MTMPMPSPPPDQVREPLRAQRFTELACWSAAVLTVCLVGGGYLHVLGPSASPSARIFLAVLIALVVLSAGTGIRQWGTRWWTTLLHAAVFAALAGGSLVALIGPDSGTSGTCSPGEACDIDQGLGFVTGPLMFLPFLVAAMAAARGTTSLVQHLRGR